MGHYACDMRPEWFEEDEPKKKRGGDEKAAAARAAANLEKQRIVKALLAQAEDAHAARNYHDRDRFRDAAWLVEKA